MNSDSGAVILHPATCRCHVCRNFRPFAAVADGPVADTAEPVAAEAGRPIPEPDRDDGDTVPHG